MSSQPKLDIQILLPFLKQLPQGTVVKHIKTLKASSRSEFYVQSERSFSYDTRLPLSEIKLSEQLKNQAQEIECDDYSLKQRIENLLYNLQPKYTIGDQFQKVTEVDRINLDENSYTKENSSFEPENGVVYLIVIWDTTTERCDKLMPLIEQMVQRNPNWKGKAKVIGISADDETEQVFQKVNENNWKSMKHYRFQDYWENRLKQFLSFWYSPFIILINKWGKVVALDLSWESNLEERINQEINAEQDIPAAKQEIQQNNEQLLTKEEFKYLKGKVYSIQEAINEIGFQGTVKVTLEKINVWKPDGTKEVQKRSKLNLEYNIRVLELDKLNNLLENHWNTIPENLREITSSRIRDTERQIEEIKAKFFETFAALGVTIKYYKFDTHKYQYDTEKQMFEFITFSQIQLQVQGFTVDRFETGKNQIKDQLDQYQDSRDNDACIKVIDEINWGLRHSIEKKVGEQFETINNYKKWNSEEYVNIEHKPGQVLIIYYDYMSGSFIEQKEQTYLLFKKNAEKWGNDVRIIYLFNEERSDIKQIIDSHEEWQKYIDFYFSKYDQQEDIFKYCFSNSGHIMVVDKFNTIIRFLDTVEIVEELVTSLLSEQQQQLQEEKVEIQVDPSQIQEILVSSNAILTQADPQKVLQLELVLKSKTFNKTLIVSKPGLSIFARDSQEQLVQSVLNQLFNVIPESQWTISKTISRTVSIPYPGQECAVCKKDITQEPQQYYSPFKYEHVCTECAEYDDKEKKGNARFKYLDTLVFINGPLSDPSVLHNIDDHKLGKNKKLQDGDEGSQEHQGMSCSGCGGDFLGPRYISITARAGRYREYYGYVEYCQNCFLTLKDKTLEKAKEIVAKDIKQGMVLDSLFTRVLFYHGRYQDF